MSCEKVRYATREEARRARRRLAGRDRSLRPYRCLDCVDVCWHLGRLPASIRRGDLSRGEVYGEA